MTLNEFKVLTAAWGGDITRWPNHLQSAAEALARTPAAVAILAEARDLDHSILELKPEIASARIDSVIYKVVGAIAAETQPRTPRVFSRRWWLVPATGFACAAIAGISVGIMSSKIAKRSADVSTVLTTILESGSYGPDWVLQ